MTPERRKEINGHVVEEFYWAGRLPVYVDNRLVQKTFKEACVELKEKE